MEDYVKCNNCGITLYSDISLEPERRRPCPVCGSTTRQVSVTTSVALRWNIKASETVFNIANLLLQTVVETGAKTSEGQLIEAVTLPWFEIIEWLKKDPSRAYQIGYRKWEEIIAGAYLKAGFDPVTLTPPSGDHGRDIIAIKHGLGTVRIIDQVKAYNPKHLVEADDVRALYGVVECDKASKGFLTTTSDFAPRLLDDPLLKPLIPARIELINGKMLLARLEELAKKH